jgi:hypothetical protein
MDVLSDPLFRNVIFPIAVAVLLILFFLIRGIAAAIFRPPKNPEAGLEIDKNSHQPMSPGESIGSISVRLGEDIRDVWDLGFSDDQINGVLTGKYSLEELYKMDPEGNTKTSTGQAILAKRGQKA